MILINWLAVAADEFIIALSFVFPYERQFSYTYLWPLIYIWTSTLLSRRPTRCFCEAVKKHPLKIIIILIALIFFVCLPNFFVCHRTWKEYFAVSFESNQAFSIFFELHFSSEYRPIPYASISGKQNTGQYIKKKQFR